MSLTVMNITQIEEAVNSGQEIVQIFKSDLTMTAFALKSDYAEHISNEEQSAAYTAELVKRFDTEAFLRFLKVRGTPFKEALIDFIGRMYEGLQLKEESGVGFYEYETTDNYPHSVAHTKLNPSFFPKGTLVTVSRILMGMHTTLQLAFPSVFTVNRVVQNGVNSFLLETTTPDTSSIAEPGELYKFNIHHVTGIVMRGIEMDVEYYKDSFGNDCGDHAVSASDLEKYATYNKSEWMVHDQFGLGLIIRRLVGDKLKGKGVALDAWGMVCLLEKQTFVKVSKPVFSRMYEMRLVNKKRTKRFVKQNVNRFLYSAEKRQRELDDRYDNYYSTMDYYSEAFTDDAIPSLK